MVGRKCPVCSEDADKIGVVLDLADCWDFLIECPRCKTKLLAYKIDKKIFLKLPEWNF